MQHYIAITSYKSAPHKIIDNRLKVKAFANADALGVFLCAQDDNKWQEVCQAKLEAQKYPVKSGVYAFAGGAWHNVKNLDASVLAHI